MTREATSSRKAARPAYTAEPRERRKVDETDRFWIDPQLIPDGMSLNWKRKETYGKEDRKNLSNAYQAGWRPVHRSLLEEGETGTVELDDLILMERPIEMTREAEREDYERARIQVTANNAFLKAAPSPNNPRTGKARATIKRSYSTPEISD